MADAERLASGVAATGTPMGAIGRLGSSVCFEGVAAAEIFVTPAFEGVDERAAKIFTADEDENEGETPRAPTAVSAGEARGGETSVSLTVGIGFSFGFGFAAAGMLGLISAAVCAGEVFVGVGGARTDEVIVERASERARDTPMLEMGSLEALSCDSYEYITRSVEINWNRVTTTNTVEARV